MIVATCHLFESSLTFQMVIDESKCQDVVDMTITTNVSQKDQNCRGIEFLSNVYTDRAYVTDYCKLKKKSATFLFENLHFYELFIHRRMLIARHRVYLKQLNCYLGGRCK